MKTMKSVFAFSFLLLFMSCSGQPKPIGEKPLDLCDFNFNTKISTLLPDKYKSREFAGYYDIPSKFYTQQLQKDTTYIDKYSDTKKPVGIEYLQQSSSSIDVYATFQKQSFNKINIATTLDNQIMVICAVADETTMKECQNFIKILTNKYGKYKKQQSEFGSKFYIYEWHTDNAIIKYSTVFNDESKTLKISLDQTNGNISNADKEPHFEGYFYIIKKEYTKEIKNLKTGDFVFIN